MKVFMWVTDDRYELPLAVADSLGELAEIVGSSSAKVGATIRKARQRGTRHSKYVEVFIDEEEEA